MENPGSAIRVFLVSAAFVVALYVVYMLAQAG